mgnify:CR=1 FL=1
MSVTVENPRLSTMVEDGIINLDKAKLIEEILPKIKSGDSSDQLFEQYDVPDIMLANRVWQMETDK